MGYVTAICNEKGGSLIIGMYDKYPHEVIGTKQNENAIGILETNIYRDTGIRVDIYELFEAEKRVLVIDIPRRPAGKIYKFEDVALMRVGEALTPMSDEVYLSIIQEQEPDFSEQICEGVTTDDLDPEAIQVLKDKYAQKQKNASFRALSDNQALSDLGLIQGSTVTNAALILLGKENIIAKYIPQATVMLEYRANDSHIHFDQRNEFRQPFFLMIDKLWGLINLRNGSIPIRDGVYKSDDIVFFNEDVIREAVNNAIAHRDYRRSSETIIKQFSTKMEIISSGGFPNGVTLANLLTVPSTPRNRLLADVLSKTGLVERSGQGVDRIYLNTISEGKPAPDYSKSDSFCVVLKLSAVIEDIAFAKFIRTVQESQEDDKRMTVFDVITLNDIRLGVDKKKLDVVIVKDLLNKKLIETRGKTSGLYYILCKDYYEYSGNLVEYSKKNDWDIYQAFTMVNHYLEKHSKSKMGEFVKLFEGHLTRKQTRIFVEKMVEKKLLTHRGEGNGRYYLLSDDFFQRKEFINQALQIGLEAIAKNIKGPKIDQE